MTSAILILWLVTGHSSAIPVDPEICMKTVEAVRRGDLVTVEDQNGTLFQVEKARCVLDVTIETQEPTS